MKAPSKRAEREDAVRSADDDTCYENPTGYDEWYNPTSYGSHYWGYDYTEEAGCEYDGYVAYSCYYCGLNKYEPIPATGHSWSEPTYVEDPNKYNTLIWGVECENSDCDEVRATSLTIKKGKTKRLFTKKSLKQLKKLTNRKIKWSSSKKKVATVKDGKIKAKKKGTTTIKAKIYVKKYKTWICIKTRVVVK